MAGFKDNGVGKAEEVQGKVTDDKTTEAKGDVRQLKGKVADKVEQVKEHVADTADRRHR